MQDGVSMVFLQDTFNTTTHVQRLDNGSNGSLGVWLRHEVKAPNGGQTYRIYIGVRVGGGFNYTLNPVLFGGGGSQRAIFTISEYAP